MKLLKLTSSQQLLLHSSVGKSVHGTTKIDLLPTAVAVLTFSFQIKKEEKRVQLKMFIRLLPMMLTLNLRLTNFGALLKIGNGFNSS